MYFDTHGKTNTDTTLKLAGERASALGLKEIVVASTSGETALKLHQLFPDLQTICVTYHAGFRKPFQKEMPDEMRKELEDRGVRVIMSSHALSGVERSVAKKHGGIYPALLIADTLRLFGQGLKVAVEIAIMAADAGALSGQDIVSAGGSGKGADAALVLKPAHQSNLFDMRIREVICKPRSWEAH